jgi:gluconolactonase
MKGKSILFVGAITFLIVFTSCQKSMKDSSRIPSDDLASNAVKHAGEVPGSLTDGSFAEVTYVHDATNTFTEGPAVDKFGNVFFTDQNHDKIYRWDAGTGAVSLWLTGTGRANGMAFDKDGSLIACADMHGELWKIRPDGSHEVLVDNYNGKLLNGPNDVWINPVDRGVYITDPIFPRDYWDLSDPRRQPWEPHHSEQSATDKGGHVYYLAPGSRSLVRVTTMPGWNTDSWPNGIVGTPDGKKLYVNQWSYNGSGGIWSFDINKDGTLSNMQTFVPNLNFCDGMSLDEFGNVYVSAGGVRIYSPQGVLLKTIATPGGASNNVFGALDQRTLFITGGGSGKIFTQRMNVTGVERFGGEHLGQIK